MPEFQKIVPTKAHTLVAQEIRRRIVRGELPVGSQLPSEQALTEQFGIARTTLREALRVLEYQQLIRIRRGRGGGGEVTMPRLEHASETVAALLQMEQTTYGELDELRMTIECFAVRLLASAPSHAAVGRLGEIADLAIASIESGDHRTFGNTAAQFHQALLELSENRAVYTIGTLLHGLAVFRYVRGAVLSEQPVMLRAARSYEKLRDLIAAGEVEAAVDHWERQMRWMIENADGTKPIDTYAIDFGV